MSGTRTYKRIENNLVRAFSSFCKGCFVGLFEFIEKVINGGRKKLTIMIVPHSQKKVINFQASIFSIIFAAILLCGVTASFFWFTTESIASAKKLADLKEETRKAQASLEVLKNETSSLLKNAKGLSLWGRDAMVTLVWIAS